MSSQPFFSVIIPTYNRAHLIGHTLATVLEQTFGDFEVIVVDDGSNDATAKVVQALTDPRIRYVFQENGERSKARNNGTGKAAGKYITFLDSDDCFYADHLAKAKELIEQHADSVFFHMRYELVKPGSKREMPVLKGDLNRQLAGGNFMSCNAVFLRSEVAKTNLFNESLDAMEDWELWLRIAAQHKLAYAPVITSAIIEHDSRSVLQIDKGKLIRMVTTFLAAVKANRQVVQYYEKDMSKLISSCYTYISLHIALTKKDRLPAVRYLLKGISAHPGALFQRRTLAIFRHLLMP